MTLSFLISYLQALNSLLVTDPNCHVIILGDFNVHNQKWLVHSSHTSVVERKAEQFTVVSNLSQLIDLLTHARLINRWPCITHPPLLTLPSLFSTKMFPFFSPIWIIGPLFYYIFHQLHRLQSSINFINCNSPSSSSTQYNSTTSDDFRDFLVFYPWSNFCFIFDISSSVSNCTNS